MSYSKIVTALSVPVFLVSTLACCLPAPSGTDSSSVSKTVKGGDTVTLARQDPKDPDVWVTTDDAAMSDLIRFSTRRDAVGVAGMMDRGTLLVVPRGTRATVTDPGLTRVKVRINDGKYAGREVVVVIEDVNK